MKLIVRRGLLVFAAKGIIVIVDFRAWRAFRGLSEFIHE
jgi:hypothetical protein